MSKRKVLLSTFVGILALMTLWAAAGQGQETGTATVNQYGTGTTGAPPSSSAAAAEQTNSQSAPTPGDGAKPRNYNDSPESVTQLLKDSSAAMESASDNRQGVHVVEKSFFSLEGESTLVDSEGDVMLPDRAMLDAEIHLPKRQQPVGWNGGPIMVKVIVIGNTLYLKPSFCNCWSEFDMSKDSDQLVSDVDLEAIHFYDYMKTSTNLGQETLADGTRVYHVQVEIDAPKLIDKIESIIDPAKRQKYGPEFDKLKSSVINNDIWIGTDNLLVYQAVSKMYNIELQIDADDSFRLSNWGEVVDISAPTDATSADFS
jgi:hypothetical protein